MKLAIIDLDGTVANRDAREAKAKEIADQWLAEHRHGNVILKEYGTPGVKDIYWQAFFNPEYVHLDTLIDGTYEAMNTLMEVGYLPIYLTSRPESMRWATLAWLGDHDILHHINGGNIIAIQLVMKPSAFQYTKTPIWKAGTVQMLAHLHDATEIIYVDDKEENVETVVDAWEGMLVQLRTWSSLKLALAIRHWE